MASIEERWGQHERLHSYLGNIPPEEEEQSYCAQRSGASTVTPSTKMRPENRDASSPQLITPSTKHSFWCSATAVGVSVAAFVLVLDGELIEVADSRHLAIAGLVSIAPSGGDSDRHINDGRLDQAKAASHFHLARPDRAPIAGR
jgi:hypothetical protein